MTRYALRVVLLATACALGTWVAGWWAVPALGLVWGVTGRGTDRPALTAGLAAATGWGLVLVISWVMGPLPLVAAKLGAITGLGGVTWIAATLVLPFLLAWSAAEVVRR